MKFRILPPVMIVCTLLLTFASPPAQAGEQVTVELRDGRAFAGAVDPRSDEHRLWLRFGSPAVRVLRPIKWDSITSGSLAGGAVTIEQLRQVAAEAAANPNEAVEAEPDADAPPTEPETHYSVSDVTDADRARQALGFTPRVATVDFDVYAANWDADVEVDGLVVHVYPRSRDGQFVDVRGTLDVQLHGLPRRDTNSPHHRGQPLRNIGKWTRALGGEADAAGGFTVQLPFQALHPQFDPGIGAAGLVDIRLAIPGHGVFSAARDGVRIRPYSPIRDALQQESGRRFLSSEMTGRR